MFAFTRNLRGNDDDDGYLSCEIDIEMQGYESDNLAVVYNQKIKENELVFTFMGYKVPEEIYTPCSIQSWHCTELGKVCVNNATNDDFYCENGSMMRKLSVFVIVLVTLLK